MYGAVYKYIYERQEACLFITVISSTITYAFAWTIVNSAGRRVRADLRDFLPREYPSRSLFLARARVPFCTVSLSLSPPVSLSYLCFAARRRHYPRASRQAECDSKVRDDFDSGTASNLRSIRGPIGPVWAPDPSIKFTRAFSLSFSLSLSLFAPCVSSSRPTQNEPRFSRQERSAIL